MEKIPRDQFIEYLQNRWRFLVDRFDRLAPDQQDAYLKAQGYARLPDLLGHVIAWWQDGFEAVKQMQANPAYPLADYDVDRFNAAAVEKFAAWEPPAVRQEFEMQRRQMVDLVTNLSDSELNQENINTRLYYEIVMHWNEHALEE